jgi:uncharacterized membrane protein YfcA
VSPFESYFQIGLEHILDTKGYDHILFIIALCAVYTASDWKKIIILVTAFTIGHSITLALSALHVIEIKEDLVEFLIPLTILATAISNLFKKDRNGFNKPKVELNYFLALFFGLIHGLGFSTLLKALLGQQSQITQPLLAFNLGLEVGQLAVVGLFMVLTTLVLWFGVSRRDWRIMVSSAVGGIALVLLIEAKYW